MTLPVCKKSPRHKLLGALFAKGAKLGIDKEEMREVIAPAVIGKRLSAASSQEIVRVVEHITQGQKYPSSLAGLIQELEDIARARWGESFEKPLNAFINSNRKTPTHYRFLNVRGLKGTKERIKELNREGKIYGLDRRGNR